MKETFFNVGTSQINVLDGTSLKGLKKEEGVA
jgi:hypothetical protein